jgi:CheY-like chemotaxis protein
MAASAQRSTVVLVAEDDDDDFLLTREAFNAAQIRNKLIRVRDGEELLDFLLRRNSHRTRPELSRLIILLDLNMPRKDGREALREIKSHEQLRRIPVIALTTSKAENDILHTYELGVNCFIRKPVRLDEFVDVVRSLKSFWLETAQLPSINGHA